MLPPGTPPVILRHERDRRPGRVWRRPGQTGLWHLHRHGLGSRRRGRKSVRWDCWTDSRGRPTACGAGHQRAERSLSPSGGRRDEGRRARRRAGQRQVDPVHGPDARGLPRRPGQPRRGPGPRSAARCPDPDGAIGENRRTRRCGSSTCREASRARRASPGCARQTRWRSWCGASAPTRRRHPSSRRCEPTCCWRTWRWSSPRCRRQRRRHGGSPGGTSARSASRRMPSTLRRRCASRRLSPEDAAVLRGFAPLTLKPEIVIANLEEGS